MFARSHLDLHNVRASVERVKKLSDNVIGVGPVGLGLDGILAWIPMAGKIYSAGAGGLLIVEAIRARSSATVLVQMSAIILIDVFANSVPGVGALADMLFAGHKWSANLLLKHMDDTIYFEGRRADVKGAPEYADLIGRIRSGREKRRVVFLG